MNDAEKNCPNCKRDVAASNFRIHSAHCERKIRLCKLCDELIPRDDFDTHFQSKHTQKHCSFCTLPFEEMMIKQHETECYKRPTYCKFCTCEFEFQELSEHESNCKLRTEEDECNEFVEFKDTQYAINDLSLCEKKKKVLKVCKYCQLEYFPEKDLDHEIMCGARTEKCSMCNTFVTKQDSDNHLCRKPIGKEKLITCKYCEEKYPEENHRRHEATCDFRGEKCFRCNELVPFQYFKDHQKHCIKKNEIHTPCPFCKVEFPLSEINLHKETCREYAKERKFSDKMLKFEENVKYKEQCRKISENSVGNLVFCSFCNVQFRKQDLPSHEKCCSERIEVCLQCDEKVMIRDKLKHKIRCPMKDMPNLCPLCFEHVSLNEIEEHYKLCYLANTECATDALKEITSPSGSVDNFLESSSQENENEPSTPCPFCKTEFPISCLSMHKETCGEHSEKCENCDKFVKAKDETKHKEKCQKKSQNSGGILVLCSFCKLQFEKKDFASHEESCYERYEVCPQCEIEVKKEDTISHKNECPMKDMSNLIECAICFEHVMLNDLGRHSEVCFGLNSASSLDSVKKVTHLTDCMDHSSHLSNQANKHKKDFLGDKRDQCPYCHKFVSHDNFEYHKRYCNEALKKCPLCQENFHIKDEERHTKSCDALKMIEQKKFEYGDPAVDSYLQRERKKMKDISENKNFGHDLYRDCPFCQDSYFKNDEKDHMLKCRKINSDCYFGSGAKPKIKNKNKKEKPNWIMNTMKKGVMSLFGQGSEDNNSIIVKNHHRQFKYDSPYNKTNSISSKETPVMIPCEFCNKPLILNEEEIALHVSSCPANEYNHPPKESSEKSSEIKIVSNIERKWITGKPDDSLSPLEPSQETEETFTKETEENFTFMTHFSNKYSLDNKIQIEDDSQEKEFMNKPLSNNFNAEKETGNFAIVIQESNQAKNDKILEYVKKNDPKAEIKENFGDNKEEEFSAPLFTKNIVLTQSEEESLSAIENNYETFHNDKDIKYTKPGEFLKDGYYCTVNESGYSNKEAAKSYFSKTETVSGNEMNEIRQKSHVWKTLDSDSEKSEGNKCHLENADDCYVSKESIDTTKSHLSKTFEETGSKMINEMRPSRSYNLWETSDSNSDKSASNKYHLENVEDCYLSKESIDNTKSHLSKQFEETGSKVINKLRPNKSYHLWETFDCDSDKSAGNKHDQIDNSNISKELKKSASKNSSNFSSSLNNHNSTLNSEECSSNNEFPVSDNSYKSSNSIFNQYNSKEIDSENYSIIASSEMKGPIKIERLSIKKTFIQQNKDLNKVESSELITEKITPGFDNSFKLDFEQHFKDSVISNYPIDFQEKETLEKKEVEFNKNVGFNGRFTDETLKANFERIDIHENVPQHQNEKAPYYEISNRENIHANEVPDKAISDEQPMDVDDENQDRRKYNILLRGNFQSNIDNFSHLPTTENNEYHSKEEKAVQDSCNYIKQDESVLSDLSDSENMNDLESYFQFLDNKLQDNIKHNICPVCENEICLCKINASLSNEKSLSFSEISSKEDSIETVKNGNKLEHVKNDLNPVFNKSPKQVSKARQKSTYEEWVKWREMNMDSEESD